MALSTDLFSSLRKDILQGRLRQGEKLTEQQVCDEYKVSRTPVREALNSWNLRIYRNDTESRRFCDWLYASGYYGHVRTP